MIFLLILYVQEICANDYNILRVASPDITESAWCTSAQRARNLLRDEINEFSIADHQQQKNFFTQSTLLRAVRLGDENCVKDVIKRGLNINDIVENEGLCILNKAILNYDSRSVEIILRNGATLKTKDGQLPLFVALEHEIQSDSPFTLKIKLLLKAGANPDCLNNDGKSLDQLLNLQQSRIEKKPPIGYMGHIDFIKKVTLLLHEARKQKKIVRDKVIQFLTNPQFIDDKNNFVRLPEELAKQIAELAYSYCD
jgi:hypothetical protein